MNMRLQSVIVLVIAALVLLSGVPVSAGDRARQDEPVTFYHGIADTNTESISYLDPLVGYSVSSQQIIENVFLGLLGAHPVSITNAPELAVSWIAEEHGRVWVFKLRDDIPWVRWDPVAGKAEVMRMVTAHDAAYAIQRACDPRLESYSTFLLRPLIAGCDALAARPLDQVTEEDYDLVAVQALDDTTLRVDLRYAAGYFLSLTLMYMLYPVPREIIKQHGEGWTQPGVIVTNGPFMLDEAIPGIHHVLIRNPFFPADLRGPGNVERVVMPEIDPGELLDSFRANQFDCSDAYEAEVMQLSEDELVFKFSPYEYYLGFTHDKPPFDNVHVRRAFSAAFDSVRYVAESSFSKWLAPMIHFMPPGIFGAPPIDEIGVGYDPEYAREQLALGGYPGCEGFPEFRIVVETGHGRRAEFLDQSIQETLGCRAGLVRVEEVEFEMLITLIDPVAPPEERPEMWELSWGADYPDAHNYVGDVLSCFNQNSFMRPCSVVDDLIDQAAAETDLVARAALYRDIEERFFGPEGEHPMIPLYLHGSYLMAKSWIGGPLENDGINQWGVLHYDWYTIDQAAQLAARGG